MKMIEKRNKNESLKVKDLTIFMTDVANEDSAEEDVNRDIDPQAGVSVDETSDSRRTSVDESSDETSDDDVEKKTAH